MTAYNGEEMRKYLQSIKNDSVLSRRLDIVQAQIPIAYENGNTEALENLQNHEQLIIDRRMELDEAGQ